MTEVLPTLLAVARDESAFRYARCEAAWTLGEAGAREGLEAIRLVARDAPVGKRARLALAAWRLIPDGPFPLEEVREAFASEKSTERFEATRSLLKIGRATIPSLEKLHEYADLSVREEAGRALRWIRGPSEDD